MLLSCFEALCFSTCLSCCLVFSSSQFSCTWPCWPLIPIDFSSLYLIHLPLPVCNPCCWHPGGYLIPWIVSRGGYAYYFEGSGNGQWALLTSGLSCIWWMCDVLFWLHLKSCGQGRNISCVNRTTLLAFPWVPHLCSLLVPLSGRQSCGQQWKRSRSRHAMIMAERVPDMIGRCLILCVVNTIPSGKSDIARMNHQSHFPAHSG